MLPIETEMKQSIRIEKKLTVEIADIVHTFKGNSNLSKTEKSFDIKDIKDVTDTAGLVF